jgi:dolichol-phosphate mannosyltransferase
VRAGRALSATRRALGAAQLLAAAVLLRRLARGRRRHPPLRPGAQAPPASVSAIVPARDEARRLRGCVEPLLADPDVAEVVVVDDRSRDGTAELAAALGARVVAGRPLPAGWVGKPWALQQGLEAARGEIVVALDADTRPRPGLVRALAAALGDVELVSATARFECRSPAERVLHPSLLATLVVRFGPLDAVGHRPAPSRAVIDGQCVAVRRESFLAAGGFALAARHMTDDVALARALARRGRPVAVRDGGELLAVRMFGSAAETWHGWGRSIAMADVTPAPWLAADVATVVLTMAVPPLRLALGRGSALDAALLAVRWLLHVALAPAYAPRGAAFWAAPLADPLSAARLAWSALRPARTWRGRTYAR